MFRPVRSPGSSQARGLLQAQHQTSVLDSGAGIVIPPGCPDRGEGGDIQSLPGASGAECRVQVKPVVSSRPSIRFMFWTAAPEAPLPRLSNRAVTVNWPSLPAVTMERLLLPALALA